MVNLVGVDINKSIMGNGQAMLEYIAGLGVRKAKELVTKIQAQIGENVACRKQLKILLQDSASTDDESLVHMSTVYKNCCGFLCLFVIFCSPRTIS